MPQIYFENSSLESQFKKEMKQNTTDTNVTKTKGISQHTQNKKQKPAELVHNLVGDMHIKNNSIAKPRNLEVLMKGNSVFEAKRINNNNALSKKLNKTDDKLQTIDIKDTSVTSVEKDFTKPAIAACANTTKSVKFEQRVVPMKQMVSIPKPAKKSEEDFDDYLLERTSSMGFDSPYLVLKKSDASHLEISPSLLKNRVSSTDVQKSVKDKLKMFDQMDEDFYQIINQMTMENDLNQSKSLEGPKNFKDEQCKSHESIIIQNTISTNASTVSAPIDNDTFNASHTLTKTTTEFDSNVTEKLKNSKCLISESSTSSLINATELRESTENLSSNEVLGMKVSKRTLNTPEVQNNSCSEETCKKEDGNDENTPNEGSKRLGASTEESGKLEVATDLEENEEDVGDFDKTENTLLTYQSTMNFNKEVQTMENEIRNEDIIAVKGCKFNLVQKDIKDEHYENKEESVERKEFRKSEVFSSPKTIHHFCITHPSHTLDVDAKNMSRLLHTPAKFKASGNLVNEISRPKNTPAPLWELASGLMEADSFGTFDGEEDSEDGSSRLSLLAEKIMDQLVADSEIKEKNFLKLQHVINEIFEKKNNNKTTLGPQITGKSLPLNANNDRLYQTPAPPKFALPPYLVTETLAPEYIGISDEVEDVLNRTEDVQVPVSEYAEIVEDITEAEKQSLQRTLNRNHHSAMAVCQIEKETVDDVTTTILEERKQEEGEEEIFLSMDEDDVDSDDDTDDNIDLESSYRFESVLEIRRKQKKTRPDSARPPDDEEETEEQIKLERPHSQPNFVIRKSEPSHLQSDYNSIMKETKELSEVLKNLKMEDELVKKLPMRKEFVLENNQQCLSRSQSLNNLCNAIYSTSKKWKSENDMKVLAQQLDNKSGSDLSWYKEEFWYKWFDEIYAKDASQHEKIEESNRSTTLSPTSVLADSMEYRPDAFNENDFKVQTILDEIKRLSEKVSLLSNDSKLLGFHLCRRGACYGKIGDIKNALTDLNKAMELEPKLLDAYWHRHLVYRLKGNTKKALEDLERITRYNHDHCNAFRSRAEIYKEKYDISSAINSYSQAIRIDSKNPELYYLRAELFEERGDMILALEDYKSATVYDKSNTHGIWKIGMYHYKSGSWMASITDFTELLLQEPKNAQAYFYRGRASAKLFRYKNAVRDLSISINLQPNNHLAFFHRACLLRKLLPKQALQDFSVSLLLNSALENVACYLHRGILYIDLERYEQASWDFEAAMRLDKTLAPAHVNLGIIELKFNNVVAAINRFNIALRMDPTYVRAYLCRAEAYEKMGMVTTAIKDYTRVIFMKPCVSDFRMARGRLFLKKGELELASFHIRQCAEMNSGKAASVTQQAAVETFLKNFDKAINILVAAQRSDPSHSLVILLAKTYMKAKRYGEAIKTFNEAIKLLRPWNPKGPWPKEAAGVFFHIGTCQIELKKYRDALESFNSCLKISPEYAEAYFQRGLTKMKLGFSKGVHDFNRTLAYKPKFYQAYLGRAAYYGAKKRYAKAIMNCNEALKIKSNSVRALLYRGALKFNIKAYQLAIKDLTAAVQIDSNCLLAYFNRAVCFHERKHYFQALRDYSIVLMSETSLGMKAILNRGLLYYQINDIENALHDFTVALKEYPDNAQIYHAIGLCYHKLNRTDEAIESFTTALHVQPFFTEALLARGNALIDSTHPSTTSTAKRDYIRALHLNPQGVEARVNLAYSLQVEGHFMKAWNLFTRTLELKPDHQKSLEGRAMVSLQMSNVFGAFVDLNNALAVGKTAELYTNRGVVNQALGHVVNAMQDYQAAIKLDVSYSLAYYNAANLYFLHKQFQQAIAYYKRAIDWDPSDVCSYVNRGVAKSILKDNEGALKDFEEAVQLSPRWSHIYYNRGNVYFAMNMLEEADKSFTEAISLQTEDALLYKRRADVRGALGRRLEALQDYRQLIDITMKSTRARNQIT